MQIHRKGKYASETFRNKTRASEWTVKTERLIDLGEAPISWKRGTPRTIGNLIDLHMDDLREVAKPMRRSKQAVLGTLKRDLGAAKITNSDRPP